MSISIYISASRTTPLTEAERKSLKETRARLAGTASVDEYFKTGAPFDWSQRSLEPSRPEANLILWDSFKFPSSRKAFERAVLHWVDAATALRRCLPDADWRVQIEDKGIAWNEREQAYDLTLPPIQL